MNEVRPIDANALEKDFTDWYDRAYPRDKELIEIAILSVKDAPTIEAEPVKHGRWIKHRIDDPKSILHGAVKDTTCSVCGKSTPYNTEYCMHCGSKQDLGGD